MLVIPPPPPLVHLPVAAHNCGQLLSETLPRQWLLGGTCRVACWWVPELKAMLDTELVLGLTATSNVKFS